MDKNALKQHLKELSEGFGPSGYEDEVRAYVRTVWEPLVDTFMVDKLGTLVGVKYGSAPEPRPRLVLSAHMDEIAFMVCEIKNGYLRVTKVGGSDARITLAKPVDVHTRNGRLKGVFAVPPPHITKTTGGTDEYTKLDDQWIDLGRTAEDVAEQVRIGDLVTIDAPLLELLGDDTVAGKAMDNRASVAIVTAALHYLQGRDHAWDVYALSSIQEEVPPFFGVMTAYYDIDPHLGIALDCGFAEQPGLSGDVFYKITEGPQIGVGPNFHDGLLKDLRDIAKSLEYEMPLEPTPGRSGTEAWALQVSRSGVPTALVGVPIRNMHTTVETVSLKSILRTGRVLAEFITGLAPDYLDSLVVPLEDEATEEESA
jgi:tetrahedral aminopeptidase